MKFKVSLLIALVVCVLAFGVQYTYGADKPSDSALKKFEGAWFEVQYPADFRAEPSLKGRTSVEGHDSVFFVSPSGDVSLYVFSPQWNGEPSDVLLSEAAEKQLSVEEVESNGQKGSLFNIEAKDGSYFRIYEDFEDKDTNTRKVFGIRLKDKASLEQYKEMYEAFKSSLIQYAD